MRTGGYQFVLFGCNLEDIAYIGIAGHLFFPWRTVKTVSFAAVRPFSPDYNLSRTDI